ncbi:HAD-IA family hydrolase [Emcibacter sp.]|uniref:HAD-IA family hydrolase n=1 Tax=Emcibacter sp. TaxID=1979954 RepID=UPI002AA82136|nr:HAD-IA family hydrolase [Emcibacter sp.]
MKLIVFDCDGTLVDGQHMILDSMRHASRICAVDYPGDEPVRRIVGLSLLRAIEDVFPDLHVDHHMSIREAFIDRFQQLRAEEHEEPLFDDVREVLESLNDEGYLLGVATGKSRRGLINTLKNHDLEKYFITLNTADDGPGKPHPSMLLNAMRDAGAEPEETVMVGDTTYDIQMAKAARVRAIGVSWGYHPENELSTAGADHIIDRILHLPTIVGLSAGKGDKP